jgi:hypothetical protein
MANNRLYLVNKRLNERVFIGKYYPSTGWEIYHADFHQRLQAAFDKDQDASMWSKADWELEYETTKEEAADWVREYETTKKEISGD